MPNKQFKKTRKELLNELDELFGAVSFEDYFKQRVLTYPTLYADTDLEVSRLQLLDHEINTNGNGFQEDLEATLQYLPVLRMIHAGDALQKAEWNLRFEELTSGPEINVMEGFSQKQIDQHAKRVEQFSERMRTVMTRPLDVPHTTLAAKTYSRFKDAGLLPEDVVMWAENVIRSQSDRSLQLNTRRFGEDVKNCLTAKITPYPNFSYRYSMLYCSPTVGALMIKHESWRNALIEYYEYCAQYFSDPQMYYEYSGAYSPNGNVLAKGLAKRLEADFLDAFKRYNGDNAEISKAYGLMYDGNIQDFLSRKWASELIRIQQFISDTLKRINSQSNPQVFVKTLLNGTEE